MPVRREKDLTALAALHADIALNTPIFEPQRVLCAETALLKA